MKKISEPIVFFGSGPVAAESLRLLSRNFEIEAIITKPRPPHHRGDTPVLNVAEELGCRPFTASNRAELDSLFATKPVSSSIAVLIDFGIIVSESVINYFKLGIINSHFSLLPEWRGADPITFSILSGQKETGVSLMLLVPGLDEGPLLATSTRQIGPDTTTTDLTAKLIKLSDKLLSTSLPMYVAGSLRPHPQPSRTPTYSKKLTKNDGIIVWQKPAAQIEREIRAYIEWPKSHTRLSTLDIIVTKAHVVNLEGAPGSTASHRGLPMVYCGSNALVLDELKPVGKQKMTGQAFLAGYKKTFLDDMTTN